MTDRSYGRVVSVGDRNTWFEADFSAGAIRHRTAPDGATAEGRRMARVLFDLDADLEAFLELARADRVLRPLVRKRPGLRRPLVLDPFEAAVRAIVGQLVSVTAASTMVSRLVKSFGSSVERLEGTAVAFPSAADLSSAGATRLSSLGLTRAKSVALVALGERCVRGDLDWVALRREPDRAERILQSIPGIGPWTSGYVRWRGLGDPDGFPHQDLGIVKALAARGVDRGEIARRTDRWRPWRGFAVCHLWASLAD